jgi:hypothetical protein
VKHIAHLPGVLSADELMATGEHLVSLQLDTGMIPWFPGGHCDPWNHVESAMALDVAGFHAGLGIHDASGIGAKQNHPTQPEHDDTAEDDDKHADAPHDR